MPYFTWFLRVRNLGAASLAGSGSRIPPEVVVMLWAGASLSRDLTGDGGATPTSLTWLLAGGFSSSPRAPLHGAAHNIAFPRVGELREHQDGGQSAFYDLILEVMYHHPFCHILLVTQTKPGTVLAEAIQGCEY